MLQIEECNLYEPGSGDFASSRCAVCSDASHAVRCNELRWDHICNAGPKSSSSIGVATYSTGLKAGAIVGRYSSRAKKPHIAIIENTDLSLSIDEI
ncbi:uncharacterized protein STEHIDRAFT_121661 [Stereum hirsutum FP-91666 SS1]|uniref:uncharacterized protein n=1 Tax=Stereum hirsutum (strain FP-91666) TaxID=721885 RepID=UPI000444A11C|nr:uncharacterized protein STEHIDRAFT_121661 [Stereum hirsutum FP-91666 SS1]EIM86815.1 hypothetical protein STEHIDRAFT_121661 [Stereum hirsutum FP-91666 SS1]